MVLELLRQVVLALHDEASEYAMEAARDDAAGVLDVDARAIYDSYWTRDEPVTLEIIIRKRVGRRVTSSIIPPKGRIWA